MVVNLLKRSTTTEQPGGTEIAHSQWERKGHGNTLGLTIVTNSCMCKIMLGKHLQFYVGLKYNMKAFKHWI